MKTFGTDPDATFRSIRRPRVRRIALGSAAVVALATAVGAALTALPPASEATATPAAAAASLQGGYADLVESVLPAVVNVRTTRAAPDPVAMQDPMWDDERMPEQMREFMKRFFEGHEGQPGPRGWQRFGAPAPMAGQGSGFIIDPDGLIVTNAHVIRGAEKIEVVLADGREFEAELIGADSKTDLALLRIDAGEDLPTVSFGSSGEMRVGDVVLAVGNPFGLGGSVTAGILSATGREIGSGPYDDYLQIDAPINPGNSGGPTFNTRGEVVGVNTAIFSPSGGNVGIGFAVPSELAREVIADLQDDGRIERGWLGVQIQTIDEDLAESLGLADTRGALVAEVLPDSPAAAAGVARGDVIMAFDGTEIDRMSALPRIVAQTEPGSEVEITVWRDGAEIALATALALMPQEEQVAMLADEAEARTPKLGLSVAPLTPETRERYGLMDAGHGVVVLAVEPGGPAASKGIREGDLIVAVGDREVSSAKDIVEAVEETVADGKNAVLVLLHRDGMDRFAALPLATS